MNKSKVRKCVIGIAMSCALLIQPFSMLGGIKEVLAEENNSIQFQKISFEEGEVTYNFDGKGQSTPTIVQTGVTDGENALKVEYGVGDYNGIFLTPPDGKTWDLGEDKSLAFDVTNPSDKRMTIFIKLHSEDYNVPEKDEIAIVYKTVIPPKQTTSLYTSPISLAKDVALPKIPPFEGRYNAPYSWGEIDVDMHNISQITVFLLANKEKNTLIFDNFKVIDDPNKNPTFLNNIIDEYGQYTKNEWDIKIKNDDQLKESWQEERAILDEQLKERNDNKELSKYGGWKNEELRQEATGRFYTKKINGKWAFIDPEGYPYIATGVDIVRLADGLTWVTGREYMFESLPSQDEELGAHYSTITNSLLKPKGVNEGLGYNFYKANLHRKYGDNFEQEWRNISIDRFKAWGFTTIGCWAEPALFFGKGEEMEIPYIANGWINGQMARIPSTNGSSIADPFDPAFRKNAEAMAQRVQNYNVDEDPWCIGIYVDNEITWGNAENPNQYYMVVDNVMKMDSSKENAYAKRAFIDILKNKYKDIKNLNEAWGTQIDSWETLMKPYSGDNGDRSMLLSAIADKYYSTVDEVLKEILPNTLYLGSRFQQWGVSPEVENACAKYADVVSYNCYHEDINQHFMHPEEFDKPIMIGEFAFTSTDEGNYAIGSCPVPDQKARGEAYKKYIQSVLDSDYCIGAQWFQYYDQPASGRAWNGENNGMGFVDVTDQPHTELIDAAREIHAQMYELKFLK